MNEASIQVPVYRESSATHTSCPLVSVCERSDLAGCPASRGQRTYRRKGRLLFVRSREETPHGEPHHCTCRRCHHRCLPAPRLPSSSTHLPGSPDTEGGCVSCGRRCRSMRRRSGLPVRCRSHSTAERCDEALTPPPLTATPSDMDLNAQLEALAESGKPAAVKIEGYRAVLFAQGGSDAETVKAKETALKYDPRSTLTRGSRFLPYSLHTRSHPRCAAALPRFERASRREGATCSQRTRRCGGGVGCRRDGTNPPLHLHPAAPRSLITRGQLTPLWLWVPQCRD